MSGTSGRRVAEREQRSWRPDPMLAVGVVAVLLTGLALFLHAPASDPAEPEPTPPTSRPLVDATLVCPPSMPGSPPLALASGREQGDDGSLEVRIGDEERDVDLAPSSVTTVPGTGTAVLHARDDLAPGLLGARFGSSRMPAAGECVTPAGERWFVGVGAGGLHQSTLHLVNPDAGPAVADVRIWSTTGPLDEVESRGLTVPGGGSSELDLTELVPEREELALQVRVSRGRIAARVEDSYEPAEGDASRDWLAWARPPAEAQLVPGVPRKADENTLVLVNPGESAGRVTVRVVGKDGEFTPRGLSDIEVPAGSVAVEDLTEVLQGATAGEDVSLRLTSTVPVAATLRSVVEQDLVHLPAVPPVTGPSGALVPKAGKRSVVLTAPTSATRVALRFPGADGKDTRVRLKPGTTTVVPVPAAARAVLVSGSGEYVGTLRRTTPAGASATPLRQLELEELVPAVRPDWP